jgi:hypothetical protein
MGRIVGEVGEGDRGDGILPEISAGWAHAPEVSSNFSTSC